MQEAPPELLLAARSPDWSQRREAAAALAGYDGPRAADALLDLLRDEHDTGPIQAAADALVQRRDAWGASLIFQALATGGADAVDHLVLFIAWAGEETDYAFLAFARAALDGPDATARAGARRYLDFVGGGSSER